MRGPEQFMQQRNALNGLIDEALVGPFLRIYTFTLSINYLFDVIIVLFIFILIDRYGRFPTTWYRLPCVEQQIVNTYQYMKFPVGLYRLLWILPFHEIHVSHQLAKFRRKCTVSRYLHSYNGWSDNRYIEAWKLHFSQVINSRVSESACPNALQCRNACTDFKKPTQNLLDVHHVQNYKPNSTHHMWPCNTNVLADAYKHRMVDWMTGQNTAIS